MAQSGIFRYETLSGQCLLSSLSLSLHPLFVLFFYWPAFQSFHKVHPQKEAGVAPGDFSFVFCPALSCLWLSFLRCHCSVVRSDDRNKQPALCQQDQKKWLRSRKQICPKPYGHLRETENTGLNKNILSLYSENTWSQQLNSGKTEFIIFVLKQTKKNSWILRVTSLLQCCFSWMSKRFSEHASPDH